MKKVCFSALACLLFVFNASFSLGQDQDGTVQTVQQNDMGVATKIPESGRWSVVFGLSQPILAGGFNAELVYWTENWMFDYSHGFDLKFAGVGSAKEQQLAFRMPHTLGFGVGYRFTEAFNLRLEPKIHIWDVYYENTVMETANRITTYTTFTLGLGAYYSWLPFKNEQNLLRGITIVPNVRFWPNIASTLPNNEFRYLNARTQSEEFHQANNIGIANTPFFFNISIGYTF
jgi:hypothetical protein